MVSRLNAATDEALPWPKIWAFTCNKQALRQAGDNQWLLLHGAIYDGSRLAKSFGDNSLAPCSYCGVNETAEHIFFSCQRVKDFWRFLISDWTQICNLSPLPSSKFTWPLIATGLPSG